MKELFVILLSSVKFGMTFPIAIIGYQFSIPRAIVWTNIGGILGIIAFTYLSKEIIYFWDNYLKIPFCKLFRINIKNPEDKQIFTRKTRRMVKIKSKYGLLGIALATPVIFSIPIGVFLAVRYFQRNQMRFFYLLGGNIIWSFIYSYFYSYGWNAVK